MYISQKQGILVLLFADFNFSLFRSKGNITYTKVSYSPNYFYFCI